MLLINQIVSLQLTKFFKHKVAVTLYFPIQFLSLLKQTNLSIYFLNDSS